MSMLAQFQKKISGSNSLQALEKHDAETLFNGPGKSLKICKYSQKRSQSISSRSSLSRSKSFSLQSAQDSSPTLSSFPFEFSPKYKSISNRAHFEKTSRFSCNNAKYNSGITDNSNCISSKQLITESYNSDKFPSKKLQLFFHQLYNYKQSSQFKCSSTEISTVKNVFESNSFITSSVFLSAGTRSTTNLHDQKPIISEDAILHENDMFRGIFYLPIEETKEFIGKDITQTRKINEGHFEKPKHSQKKHIKDLAPPYTRADFFADMGFILEKNKSFKHLDSERNEINASNCSSETNHLYSAEGGTFATKEENERGIGQDYSPSADSSPGGQMPARMNTPDEDVSFMFSKWTPFATKEMRFFNDVELVVDGHVESAFAAKEKEKMLRKWEKDDVALLNSNEVLKEPESGERGCSIDEEKAEESAFKSRRMAVIARQIKEAKQYQKRYGIWCRKGWISDEEEGKMWDEAERKLSCKELKEDIEDCQPTANSRISSLNMLDDSRGIDLFEMGKRTCEQESPRFFDEINESREKAKELIAKDKCVECIRQKKTEFDRNMKLTRNEVMNLDDNEITTKKENEAGEICESYQKTESLPFLKLDEESKGTANEHICLAEPSFHQNWIDFCSVKSTDGLESSFKQDEFSSLANVEKITLHNTKRRDFLNSQCNMQSNSDLFLNSSSNSEENPSQLHLTPFGLHPFKEPSFAIQRNSLNFGSELSSLNKPDFSSSFSQSDCSNITSAVQTPSITSFSSKHTSLPLSADLRGISTFSSSISTILNERHQLLTNSSSSAVHLCLSNDLCEDEPEHVILSPKNEGEIPSVSTIRVVLDENEWLSRYNDPTIPRKKIYKMIKRNKNVVGFIQDMYEIYDLVKDSPPLITPIHCTSTDSVTLIRDRKQRAKIFWKTFCELEKGVFMNSDWPFICCS